jgi:uncharacterized protein (DUF305 family)
VPRRTSGLAVALAAVLLTACSGTAEGPAPTHRVIQGAAPGEAGEVLTEMPSMPEVEITADDVSFMRHMIVHHGQALQMTELVEERSGRDDVPLFAERIHLSQEDEIRLMQEWLQTHRLAVLRIDDAGGGHGAHALDEMPGMITQEQLAELAAARGEDFDRLFLRLMYAHHDGALTMVDELQQGEQGSDPLLWNLVTDIDSDQRIEMDRILQMQADMGLGDRGAARAPGR